MKLLSKIKCRAMKRKLTPLASVIRNDIRWLSSFAMAEHYCQLDLFLRSLDHDTVAKYALDSVLLFRATMSAPSPYGRPRRDGGRYKSPTALSIFLTTDSDRS
ncbi:hypothetical protein JG688_00015918 [Phytophthora aleatoria]|uniref:Uncharacterized protein n=1 Tax=Phytophthora aleatoria TaxID=2496075 RepID=A0A8J5I9A2_9STRA|nr:hypothetical protein JG688_00015918 [Phytophthora aleatoria]